MNGIRLYSGTLYKKFTLCIILEERKKMKKIAFLLVVLSVLAVLLTACGPSFNLGETISPVEGANVTIYSDPSFLVERSYICTIYKNETVEIIDVKPYGQEGYAYKVQKGDCIGWLNLGDEQYLEKP